MATANRQFPMATHTFNVFRRNQTSVVGNNIVPIAATSTTPVATDISMALRDENDVVMADKDGAGYIYTGRFLGATFLDIENNIIIGDILEDNTDNDRFGAPVRYLVDGKSVNALYCKLHLARLDVSV
jgi:hypothetical protein